MDLHNNEEGITYCSACYPWTHTNDDVANAIISKMNNGDLRYLNPLDWNVSPPYDFNNDGIRDCPTCSNGIYTATATSPGTASKPTNQ